MKKAFLLLLTFLLFIFSQGKAKEIFVAKNGSDSNPGTFEAPYLNIGKASSQAFPGDVIYIREGVYEETLKPTRSGAPGNPIVYSPYNGEKVVITAMEALGGWTLDEGSVYKTTVNWDLGQKNFVMNGETACDLARWPNNTDGDPFTLNSLRNNGGSGSTIATNAYLDYNAGIPDFDWSQGGSIFFYCDKGGAGWTAWKSFIKSSSSTRVNFDLNKNPTWIRSVHPPEGLGDFYLEGIREAIDYDNEWYFHTATKTLYIQLPGGAEPEDGQISMRKRQEAINLMGKEYIEIRNITVFGGSIQLTGSHNLLYGVYSFHGNHTRGVVTGFSANCDAVLLTGSNNTIEKCEIAYGAASGIRFEGSSNKLINSSIHDFDYLGNYDAPVNMRNGSASTLKNNTIYRGGRDCVQMFNRGSEIAYNDISRSNLIADDCGLLYTVGGPFNMSIHHNWLHDTHSRGRLYKAAGVYLDNDAEGFVVHHNVVWNTEWASIQCNLDCKDLSIYNNTLWDGSGAMGAWHREGTSFTNVKVYNNLANNSQWEPQSDKQNNLTVYSDPFQNAASKNYQLKSGSEPIDYGRVITGITGTHYGTAPDAGAYEYGGTTWQAGIDWDPSLGPDVCVKPGVFMENDGYVIMEGESASSMGKGWSISSEFQDGMLGTGYLKYAGPDHLSAPVDSTITTFRVEITNPGTYQVKWRSREKGSSWLSIPPMDSSFLALSVDSPSEWSWESDLQVLATFDYSGIYEIQLAGGTEGHIIDRIALFIDERSRIALDTASAESPVACQDSPVDSYWASSQITDITRTEAGIVIDGLEEAEWQYSDSIRATFNPGSSGPSDPIDLGFVFRLAYDSKYLYFIAHVEDDVLTSFGTDSLNPEHCDLITLCFNPDNLHQPLGQYGEDASLINFYMGVENGNQSFKVTEAGYTLEARMAWSDILPQGITPDPNTLMGFEVQVNDWDDGPGFDDQKAWANDTRFNLSDVDTRKFGYLSLKEPEYKYAIKSGWEVIYADSEEAPGSKEKIIDGNPLSIWQTEWRREQAPLPHEIQIDFKEPLDVKEVHYLPRQDAYGPNGSIGEFEIYVSDSTSEWGLPVAKGELSWPEDLKNDYKELKIIELDKVIRGRYFRLVALSEAQNDPSIPYTAIAELDIITGTFIAGEKQELKRESEIRVYPNPVSGSHLMISFPADVSASKIGLYSLQGKLLREEIVGAAPQIEFEIGSSLAPGFYILGIDTGDKRVMKRFIKE